MTAEKEEQEDTGRTIKLPINNRKIRVPKYMTELGSWGEQERDGQKEMKG